MTGRQGLHLIAALFSIFLGFALWLAPHIDWSHVKDDSLFSSRGLLVLGLTIFVFGMHFFAALMPEQNKRRKP